jgi:hypothetical protein
VTVWPNGSATIPRVSDEFGPRVPFWTPNGMTSSFHNGIDLIGFPVNKSPVNGRVIFAAYNGGAGNMLRIRADNGDVFVIMHNARFLVSLGQRVSEGQDVGIMGTTGNSTGIHCHFETRPGGGAAVDPRGYMAQSRPAGGGSTPIKINERDDDMGTIHYRPTSNSSDIEPGIARIWAGTRKVGGIVYADVWGVDDTGEGHRLTRKHWEDLYTAAQASGRPLTIIDCTGNELEQIIYARKL